jgi:hypothetical protein
MRTLQSAAGQEHETTAPREDSLGAGKLNTRALVQHTQWSGTPREFKGIQGTSSGAEHAQDPLCQHHHPLPRARMSRLAPLGHLLGRAPELLVEAGDVPEPRCLLVLRASKVTRPSVSL